MKKLKILSVLLTLVLVGTSLASCGILDAVQSAVSAEVTIQYPDSTEIIQVPYNTTTDITPKYITGKVLMGYYETEEASGICYIDAYGKMAGDWKEHYPTTLYAVYQDINYDYVFKSKVQGDEAPATINGGVLVGSSFNVVDFGRVSDEADADYLKMVMEQNGYLDVIVTAHMMAKSSTESSVTIQLKVGDETLGSADIATGSDDWRTGTVSAKISVKQLSAAARIDIPVKFNHVGVLGASSALVKNAYYTVQFVNPNA